MFVLPSQLESIARRIVFCHCEARRLVEGRKAPYPYFPRPLGGRGCGVRGFLLVIAQETILALAANRMVAVRRKKIFFGHADKYGGRKGRPECLTLNPRGASGSGSR